MPNPIIFKIEGLTAAVATAICTAQAVAAAGNLTIDGSLAASGVATLDQARRVLITSAGNDSGIEFTVYGTNYYGNSISEVVTGANASTVQTTMDFKTVTRVAASGAAAGNVSVGTSGVASSPWFVADFARNPFNIGMRFNISGTVNYSLELTMDDPNIVQDPQGQTIYPQYSSNAMQSNNPPVPFDDMTVSGDVVAQSYVLTMPVYAWRLKVNSGAADTDYVQVEAIQSGYVGA